MRVRRGDLEEVYVEDGRATVHRGGQAIVLSDVATTILQAVPPTSAISLDEITAAVVDEMGPPEPPLDAGELTRGLVLELVASQVLVDDGPAAEEPADREPREPAGVAAVRDALRHVVSESPEGWIPPVDVSGPDFLAAAHRHRVVPILAADPTRLALPRATVTQLVAMAEQEAEAVDHLASELLEILDALSQAGVRVLAVKGLALAVQAHGLVTAHGSVPHDVLVSPLELERAHRALTSLGWAPSPGFPGPNEAAAWEGLLQDRHVLPLTRAGGSIGLRWHLGPVGESLPEFEDLWARRTGVEIARRDVATLSPYDALAQAASQSAKHRWRSLRDQLDVWLLGTRADTWQDDRPPPSREQLVSLGLAVRTFGMPDDAPPAVHKAVRLAAEA